jgi:hypothetical protein
MATTRASSVALAVAALLVGAAGAQPLPQPKVGQCPSGYRESGGYCAPISERSPVAVPKIAGQHCAVGGLLHRDAAALRQAHCSCALNEHRPISRTSDFENTCSPHLQTHTRTKRNVRPSRRP